jgi:glutamate-ammonia-ligase adenylyltransferase
VASFEAFAGYHGVGPGSEQGARGGELWERQALLRARPVVGDRGLCARITTEVLEASLQRPLPSDTAASIREMRYRLDDVRDDGALALKKGKGGLLDIDFIVQFLQLKTRLRSPSSREGLRALIKADAIPRELGEDLLQAHLFLRHIESRLRLMYGRSDVFVPRTGPGLVRLARQLGDIGAGAPERLWQEVTRTMGRTREIFDQVLSA